MCHCGEQRVRPGHEMNRFQWEKNEEHPAHGCRFEKEDLRDVPGTLGINRSGCISWGDLKHAPLNYGVCLFA